MKRLHLQQNKERKTISDLIGLLNSFIMLNGSIPESPNVLEDRDGSIYPSAGIANHQYCEGLFALFYVVSTELNDVLYTGVDDYGRAYFKPATEITVIYDKCKTVL